MSIDLVHHAVSDCKDPDCEVHNIHVAVEEGVVNSTNVAYFLAGVFFATRMLRDDYAMPGLAHAVEERTTNIRDELMGVMNGWQETP